MGDYKICYDYEFVIITNIEKEYTDTFIFSSTYQIIIYKDRFNLFVITD